LAAGVGLILAGIEIAGALAAVRRVGEEILVVGEEDRIVFAVLSGLVLRLCRPAVATR